MVFIKIDERAAVILGLVALFIAGLAFKPEATMGLVDQSVSMIENILP